MIFAPLTRVQARALHEGARLDLLGHAATASLLAAAELPAGEEADFAALSYAGVRALSLQGDALRMVVAVEVEDRRVRDLADAYGSVEVTDVAWSDVLALFTDDPDGADLVARARASARGLGMDEALDQPAVGDLLTGADLLWFDPLEFEAGGLDAPS